MVLIAATNAVETGGEADEDVTMSIHVGSARAGWWAGKPGEELASDALLHREDMGGGSGEGPKAGDEGAPIPSELAIAGGDEAASGREEVGRGVDEDGTRVGGSEQANINEARGRGGGDVHTDIHPDNQPNMSCISSYRSCLS